MAGDRGRLPPATLAVVGLLAAGGLTLEIVLMRLLAIVQWYHFAYLMVSLALAGIGAGGVLLALNAGVAGRRWRAIATAAALGFAATAPVAFRLTEWLAFEPLQALWDPSVWGRLGLQCLVLAAPFAAAGTGIAVVLTRFADRVGALYGTDLLCAGAGALLAPVLLALLAPTHALLTCAGFGVLAGAALGRHWYTQVATLAVGGGALALAWTAGWPPLVPNPAKPLPQALATVGARVVAERSGPLALLTAVANPLVPYRPGAGLSLMSPVSPPPALPIYIDADAVAPVPLDTGPAAAVHAAWLPQALAFRLSERPKVLLLGAGAGLAVARALALGARRVVAVERNADLPELARAPFAGDARRLWRDPRVRAVVADERGWLERDGGHYDVVWLPPLADTVAGSLVASHVHSVEGLAAAWRRLAPGGLLLVTHPVEVPPRAGLRLFASVLAMLRGAGVDEPGAHIAWLRGFRTAALVVSRRPLERAARGEVLAFAASRGFDPCWLPGLPASRVNRHHQLRQPFYYQAARALLSPDRDAWVAAWPFDLRPVTDDRPYPGKTLKPGSLARVLTAGDSRRWSLVELGYPVLLATVVAALGLGVLVLLLPPALARVPLPPARAIGFFSAIGVGFMALEIALLERLTLYLASPAWGAAVVLGGFLVFAGTGSALAERARLGARALWPVVALVLVTGLVASGASHWLVQASPGAAMGSRALLALASVAPLAFVLGMPMPIGLGWMAARSPAGVPWGWAVNGCASVFGAAAAKWLAVELGLVPLVAAGLGAYLLAATTLKERG